MGTCCLVKWSWESDISFKDERVDIKIVESSYEKVMAIWSWDESTLLFREI